MITDTQLDHLARLASLHISTEDKADLVHTFKSIVGLIQKLDDVKLDDEITTAQQSDTSRHGVTSPVCDTGFRSRASTNITHDIYDRKVKIGL